jgi:UDP-N-acetylglucosamine 4,6-dehydratase
MRGGEIFVPKIPSMKITDLVEAMAPGVQTKYIGIRPGEKLHEIMITDHNAPHTIDLGDRYAIEPELHFWSRNSFANDGYISTPEGFEYVSDTNPDWMSVEELRGVLQEMQMPNNTLP